MSASLLLHLGPSELITHSPQAYFQSALTLAQHPHKLHRLRRKLRRHLSTYPVFQPQRFTHNLEQAYLSMWSRYQKGQKPASFHITDPLPLDSSYH